MQEDNIFHQDLDKKESPGYVFIMILLMKEKCTMPDKERMTAILQKHLGEVECFTHSENAAGFAPKKYKVEFKEGSVSVPPQLMITECIECGTVRRTGSVFFLSVSIRLLQQICWLPIWITRTERIC